MKCASSVRGGYPYNRCAFLISSLQVTLHERIKDPVGLVFYRVFYKPRTCKKLYKLGNFIGFKSFMNRGVSVQ